MKRKKFLKITGLTVAVLLVIVVVFSSTKQVYPLSWGMHAAWFQTNDLAIGGYDAVAYFEEDKAQLGQANFTTVWKEATWQFSSLENQQAFEANPEHYAPQFGGYCAFAVSKGFTAGPDPTQWHLENGALYLFADEGVKADWLSQRGDGVINTCETNWPGE